MTKRLISLLLVVMMVFSMTITAYADEGQDEFLDVIDIEEPVGTETFAEPDDSVLPEVPELAGEPDAEPEESEDALPGEAAEPEIAETPEDNDEPTEEPEEETGLPIAIVPENGLILASPSEEDAVDEAALAESIHDISDTEPLDMSRNGMATYATASNASSVSDIIKNGKYYTDARSMLTQINNLRTGSNAWYWNADDTTKTTLTNLSGLTYDYALEQIAMRRAAELVLSFSHTRPDGTSCSTCTFQGFSTSGENIYWASFNGSIQYIFDRWAEEDQPYSGQGHRRNMLSGRFKSVGIAGFYYEGKYYWVQEFSENQSGMSDPYVGKFDPAPGNSLSIPKVSAVSEVANGIQISWDAVNGAPKYRVFYKVGSGNSWTKLGDTTGTSYTWTGAKAGTTYTFTVRCLNNGGTAYTSDFDTVGKSIAYKSTATNLATPVLSSVANVSNGVAIKWNAVSGAAQYRVFYKVGGGKSWTKIADTADTSYTWTGAKAGTTYSFTVRCLSADGKSYTSDFDATGMSVTYKATNLAMPVLSSVANASNGVTIKWNAVSGAAQYRVFYKVGNGNSWTKIGDTTGTSYTWKGALSGVTYSFTVRCLSADGKSYTSNFDTTGLSILYKPATLSAPVLNSVANSGNGVTIKWGAVSGAAKYRVFYKVGSGNSWTKIGDTTGTSYTWKGALSGVTYSFTVRCLSADGKSYTSSFDATGLSILYKPAGLATPKLSSVTSASNGVTIKWGAVSGAAQYRVFYKVGSGKSWTKIADTTGTSYTWKGALSGVTYSFTVRCLSADGKSYTSDFDAVGLGVAGTATGGQLATPSLINVTYADASGLQISWGAVSGAAKYRIFYKDNVDVTNWTKLTDTTSTSFLWHWNDISTPYLRNGRTYTFTVRCLSADGKSYTSGFDAAGMTIAYDAAPRISSVVKTTNGVTIDWGTVDAARYRVFYKIGNSTSWTKVGDTTGTSFTWNGAQRGTTYTFTVRCLNADGTAYTSGYDPVGMTITLY